MRRLLLDTDAVLRLGFDLGKVPNDVRTAIEQADRYISHVSAIEMAIKHSVGKLPLPPAYELSFGHGFIESLRELGAVELPLKLAHVESLSQLPVHHRDPFDRLLIAQALTEDLMIVSGDRKFALYQGLEVLEL